MNAPYKADHFTPAGSGSTVLVVNAASNGPVNVPQGIGLHGAAFSRDGNDLRIDDGENGAVLIPEYFSTETPPDLLYGAGLTVRGSTVEKLTGPMAPAQYAQAIGEQATDVLPATLGEPIGSITELEGAVTATHANGQQVTLGSGDPVYQGDVLETGANGSLSVVFVDDTVFSLDVDGRMVLDEMIYDPDAQTGVFKTEIVKGVFSFVSGQVAKTSPDGMEVSTPTSNIGIRGSTVLGQAGGEGQQNQFVLVPDVDGHVGEVVLSNAAGSQVLNQPGASVTLFSFNAPPPPPVILPPQDIQQNFGASLTRLVKTVANQAQQKAQQAEQKADDAQAKADQAADDARQAEDKAAQAEDEAAQAKAAAEAAQAEAETAQTEAEAALAEAEASGDEEAIAKAQAAEAKAAEAAAKAAEAQAQAEAQAAAAAAAQAEAATAQAAAQAQAQEAAAAAAVAQQAQQFNALANTAAVNQEQAFQETVQQGQNDAPDDGEAADADAAAGDTADGADTASTADTTGDGTTPEGDVPPEDQLPLDPIAADPQTLFDTTLDPFADPLQEAVNYWGAGQQAELISFAVVPVETGDVEEDTAGTGTDDNYDPVEIIFAGTTGRALAGDLGNTNFYFTWGGIASGSNYTITDKGGIDMLSFDNMTDLKVRVDLGTNTSGHISVWSGYAASESDPTHATVSFSGIEKFLLSDGPVSALSTSAFETLSETSSADDLDTDIVIYDDFQSGKTGYAYVGTDTGEIFTITGTFDGAVVFAKGGNDTINIQTASDLTAIGGANNAQENTFNYNSLASAMTAYLKDGDVYATFGSGATQTKHDLWDVGTLNATSEADTLYIESGTYHTINTFTGDDSITVRASAIYTSIETGDGNDTVKIYESERSSFTSTVLAKITDSAGTADVFTIAVGAGTYDMNDTIYATDVYSHVTSGFEYKGMTAVYATGSVNLTALSTGAILDGGAYGDTLTGSSATDTIYGQDGNDTITGGAGNDTLYGGAGADLFVYTSTTLNSGDLATGGGDTTDAAAGDSIDFSSAIEGVLQIGGTTLTGLSTNTALGATLNASNSVAFASNQIILDFDGNGTTDFTINIDASVTGATYDSANDTITLS